MPTFSVIYRCGVLAFTLEAASLAAAKTAVEKAVTKDGIWYTDPNNQHEVYVSPPALEYATLSET